MSETIPVPDGLHLSPMEWRVFAALCEGWADKRTIARAINEPGGVARYTPPRIVVCKVGRAIERYNLKLERRAKHPHAVKTGRPAMEYRIVAQAPAAEQAA